jgi:hypothetical protein
MFEKPTPEEYYILLGTIVRDMMQEGQTVRSDAGDEALLRFAFYLREALGLPQPGTT